MSDSISRQDAIRLAEQGQIQGFEWQFKKLCELSSVEPEIIRCRDCKHWKSKEYIGNNDVYTLNIASLPCKNWLTAPNWYCGSAERRTE